MPGTHDELPLTQLTSAMQKVVRQAHAASKGWKLVSVDNGLRLFELLDDTSGQSKCFKAVGCVMASPGDVFRMMMDLSPLRESWDLAFRAGTILSNDTPSSDTVLFETKNMYIHPLWASGRQFSFYRYWKREPRGSYTIVFSPPNDPVAPQGSAVPGKLLGGCILISPTDGDASVVTYALQLDLNAFKPSVSRLQMGAFAALLLAVTASSIMIEEVSATWAILAVSVLGLLLFSNALVMMVCSAFRQSFIQAFHFELLIALAGLRDMLKQSPVLSQEANHSWEESLTPRKRTGSGDDSEGLDQTPMSTPAAGPESPMAACSKDDTIAQLHALAAKHSWFKRGPADLSGENSWGMIMGDDFMVRGPNYLSDKKKMQSTGVLMPVVCVELLPVGDRVIGNVGAHPKGFVKRVARADWGGHLPPFLFVCSFHVPCSSPHNFMLNIYAAEDPTMKNSQPQSVFEKFMQADKNAQDRKFKLIPRVAEGGWFVRKACGDPPTPAIMGTKVTQTCICGPGYFEVDYDLSTSSVVGSIVRIVTGPAKSLVVDLGFLVESQTEEELPEHLLCAVRMSRVDLQSTSSHKNPYESLAFNMTRR